MKFRLGLAIAAAAGLVAGITLTPGAPEQLDTRESEPTIISSAVVARDSRADYDTARQALRWAGDANATSNAAPQWRFVGVSNAPEQVALFQLLETKSLLRLSPGASLPDGSTVESIQAGRVTVRRGTCRRTLELFRPDHIEPSADCPNGDTSVN